MKRLKTNIPGFDKLIQGGIPAGSSTLICGTPGTAKTLFSLQFCYEGAKNFKESCLYVSFEQRKEDIYNQAKQFKWDLKKLEKEGLFHMMAIPLKDIDHETLKKIYSKIKEHGIKRLVIDSLSTLSINAPIYAAINDLFLKELVTHETIFSPTLSDSYLLQRFVYTLIDELQELKVTSFLISEIGKDSNYMSRDTVSEFLCDGVIQMFFESMGGEFSRSLLVRKMRYTKNDEDIHPVEIGKNGCVIHDI